MSIELIAEVSSNHGGDVSLAEEFVDQFASAGADFVKFQTTRVRHLAPTDPHYDWFAQAELSEAAHARLIEACARAGTRLLTTVYHPSEVEMLVRLGLTTIKVGSVEAGDEDFVRLVRRSFTRVIISAGLSSPVGFPDLLACVTRYPAPHGMVPQRFAPGGYAGWSDHCIGLESCQLAILRGARIIEVHVQLPRRQARNPRAFEKTVEEFRQLRAFADDDPQRFVGRWRHG